MMDVVERTHQQQTYGVTMKVVVNPERKKALEMWLQMTNLKLTQVNGQRRYGGPPQGWKGPGPCGGCEVFISHIPRDAYEDVLIPLFASVGPLWEFRLMMNFSGQNRGFAYAKYSTPALASAAVQSLHGHVLEESSGVRLSVRRSTEKRHLCLEPFPVGMGREDLLKVLRGLSEGADCVTLKTGPGIQGMSALVAYSSHHTASMAKKVLVEAFKKIYNVTISVKWHSAAAPSAQGSVASHKAPRGLLATPANKPSTSESRASTPLPPRLLRSQSAPQQAFSKAVGGPVAPVAPPPVVSRQRRPSSCGSIDSLCQGIAAIAIPLPSQTVLLGRVCELYGIGPPRYDIQYSASGPDGFLHFTYTVHVPGHAGPFTGTVMTLPGPSAADTVEDARCAVAKQVLGAFYLA